MSTAIRNLRNWKSSAWGAALAASIGLVLLIVSSGRELENLSYDLPFRWRGDVPTTNALIIYMDAHSSEVLDHPWASKLRSRELHAKLIKRLADSHAKLIVFDVLFDEATTNDALLLQAITAATNNGTRVLVGATTKPASTSKGGSQIVPPVALFEEVVPWAMAESGGEEQILRRHYRGCPDMDNWIPSLSFRAAEFASEGGIGDPKATRWINYYGPPGWIENHSYSDVLDPIALPDSVFSNKVCFVGSKQDEIPEGVPTHADLWRSPYSSWGYARMPGIEIVATVFLNLVRGDSLRELWGFYELLLVIGTGALLGWSLALLRPLLAVAFGLASMVGFICGACWLMASGHVWFSWMVVAVQIPVSIAWSVVVNSKRLATEKAALQTQLVEAQTAMQELATGEGMATRVEGGSWSERADSAAEKAIAVISGNAPDGQTVVPDHDLVRRVGKGAYGEVWLARNVIGTFHAVKIVKREDFESDEPFDREFRGIQKFMPISRSHPGLVQILHAGRNQQLGYMYYIMEVGDDEKTGQEIHPDTYVPKNLAKEIKKHRHLPAAECLQLGLHLTSALEYLHQQNLIHRDIKPANIIFVKGAPKFADIGLVTEIAQTSRDATFLGTLGYISPEGPGTPAADVFSLGKVLYEATMGLGVQEYPELPSTMIDRPDLQAYFQLNQIILKACQEDRDQRYQTAAEMHTDLLKLQTAWGVESKSAK